MSKTTFIKKKKQLGMHPATAANRLRKIVLFALIKAQGLDHCYQCGEVIEDVDELSIEHKIPWLDSDNPRGLYFDLNNIAFSHLNCNVRAKRNDRPTKYITLICATCNMEFKRQWYTVRPKLEAGQKDFYCNHVCAGRAKGKGYGRRDTERLT